METSLKAIVRDNTGSAQSRRSRGEGSIPAVVYGMGMEPVSVETVSYTHLTLPTIKRV